MYTVGTFGTDLVHVGTWLVHLVQIWYILVHPKTPKTGVLRGVGTSGTFLVHFGTRLVHLGTCWYILVHVGTWLVNFVFFFA